MRITFIMPNWLGNLAGGIQSNIDLALHLQKRGHEVLLLCDKREPILLKQQLKSLLKGNGLIKRSDFSYLDGVDIPAKIIPHEAPLTDQDVPDGDIVVATWWETAEWVAKLSPQKGAKVYMIRHHETIFYPDPVSHVSRERAAVTYRLPLHKVVISKWLVNVIEKEYGDSNIDLVPNSIDFKKYTAPSRSKSSKPNIGFMYSRSPFKGCDISLEALNIAIEKIPNLNVIAFGKHRPQNNLPLPKNSFYQFQPPQDKIKNIYAKCDAWLFSSRKEGFGRPILEAMACKTPVIGTPAGAAPELLSKGGGILVKAENPEDMAKAILKIANMTESEWKLMSDAAYATATSYTWDDAAQLFEQALYKAIYRTKKGEL